MTDIIDFCHFTYSYPHGERPALHDISLQAPPGQFLLLAGSSGAGKSTLLRALGGLVPHFSGGRVSGQLSVAGLDPLQAGPRQLSHAVGFVFQNPEAQAVLDQVEAEIAFGLENAAVPPAEMRLRVEEALGLLELAHLRQRSLHTLSGGERQRVAIAAALALRPRILALDEPTSQLDPRSAAEVLGALARLNEDLGLTIVLAEHRLERVLRFADRVVALEAGRIMADGPLPDVLPELPHLPPLAALGRELGHEALSRTVKEARRYWPLNGGNGAGGNGHRTGTGPAANRSAPNGSGTNGQQQPPGPAAAAALCVSGLTFAYNGKPILRGVDLEVQPGEAVALMGRNGSGKTTLLKNVVGLLRPSQGEIRVQGQPTRGRDVAAICRQVAYLPQNPDDLLFADTVREELAVTLHNHGLNDVERRVPPLLQRLGLEETAAAYPRDLSVGQRQRVALGAVMVTHPGLLLLDEPTRGLDYEAKEALVALWRGWLAEGAGLLLVTHDVELAAQVADRVLILGEGEIIAGGPAAEVLGASPLFAPQIARLFPGRGWLTVEDALAGLGEC